MFVEDGGYAVGGELEFVSRIDGFTSPLGRGRGGGRSITMSGGCSARHIQPQGEIGSGRCRQCR